MNFIALKFYGWRSLYWHKGRNHWANGTESNQMNLTARVSWRFSEVMLRPSLQPVLWHREANCLCSRLSHDAASSCLLESRLSCSLHVTQPLLVFTMHLVRLNPLSHHLTKIGSLPLLKFWVSWLMFFSFPTTTRKRFLVCEGPLFPFPFCFPELKLERTELKFHTVVSFSYLSWMILI